MPTLTIDGQAVEVDGGATVLDAASKLGINIPTLCHREGLQAETSCLVCVVKVDGRDRLLPSCATVAVEGMRVESESDEVRAARRTALELLLGDHLGDCLGPCHTVCPAQMDIPAMIRLIAAGKLDEAVAVVKERIPLPAVLGRICPEICERGCRRKDVDSPVAIRLLKQRVGDHDIASADPHVPECRPSTGKRVAIIGAGPAGLSAAYYLARDGHACTIIDEREQPGGMLRYGVLEVELPHGVIDAEVA
ncbi:MAG TPA: FAD-dependent oxidoreductase, partial [Armatimonadota bacterium]|nr:FAD-dependent oxidoreductase [Armatimonadota bacterium]